jgi:hypothetical protein
LPGCWPSSHRTAVPRRCEAPGSTIPLQLAVGR